MKSHDIIGLFTEPTQSNQQTYSWALSTLLHCGVTGTVSLALVFSPKIKEPSLTQRYAMRLMELHMPESQILRTKSTVDYPDPFNIPLNPSSSLRKVAAQSALSPISQQLPALHAQRTPTPQILLQPDTFPDLEPPQVLLMPSLLLRSAEQNAAKSIVPPPPQKEVAAKARPVLDLPNAEANLADIEIASAPLHTEILRILPSTTSPVVVHGPERAQNIPETASDSAKQATPVSVISVSDIRMTDGVVPLPRISKSSTTVSTGDLSLVRSERSTQESNGVDAGPGNNAGSSSGSKPSTRRITAPKNGKFGMVVVGTSLEEIYPETSGVWNGRLAYTVYLHVGLAKSWILQYSQPAFAEGAATGSASRLEAPWPTDMLIPALGPGAINADAVLVHGFLNKEGLFEKLAIVFPPRFALAQFMLDALQKWQFRPAMQNRQPANLEVLLIIPEEQQNKTRPAHE